MDQVRLSCDPFLRMAKCGFAHDNQRPSTGSTPQGLPFCLCSLASGHYLCALRLVRVQFQADMTPCQEFLTGVSIVTLFTWASGGWKMRQRGPSRSPRSAKAPRARGTAQRPSRFVSQATSSPVASGLQDDADLREPSSLPQVIQLLALFVPIYLFS